MSVCSHRGRSAASGASLRQVCAAVAVALAPGLAGAQQVQDTLPREASLEVFLDCSAPGCDTRFFREEIAYVNWMRDRQDADVHVIITAARTGSGGWEYDLEYLGRGAFLGRNNHMRAVVDATDTQDERRNELVRALRLGLVPYVAATPAGANLSVVYTPADPTGREATVTTPEEDPWHGWVFRTSVGGSMFFEESITEWDYDGSFSADWVTDMWKFGFSARGEKEYEELTVESNGSDTTYVDEQDSWRMSGDLVRALGAHWSGGFELAGSGSSFVNRDRVFETGPALEYSVFPYDEASRRALLFVYKVIGSYTEYQDTTIYGKIDETLLQHSLQVTYRATQPWGGAHISLQGRQYLHDPVTLYGVEAGGGISLRVTRGLNLNLSGNAELIRDQLYISGEDLDVDDILLRRRQLETAYQYRFNVGLSYRFGSSFNNVVNRRLEGLGRRFFFF